MKNQGNSSRWHVLLSIKSLWNGSQNPADVSIERTFSNESTIEKDGDICKYPSGGGQQARVPQSPTSVANCDIFRPLRETFFSDEMENMLTLKRARPICCGGSLLDVDDGDENEEASFAGDASTPPLPLKRQDALLTTLDMLERDEEETVDSSIPRVVGISERRR